jgi:hypothetical protein
MGFEQITRRPDGKEHRKLSESYRHYLEASRKEGNPREAHVFALSMAHRGVTFGKSIAEVVVELEGKLPGYWTDPHR